MTVLDAGSCLLIPDDRRVAATVSTAELLQRISQDDSAAWAEIVRRYEKLVVATLRSFRLQDADVRDAVQTTWLRLWQNADRIRDPQRLGGWLVTTARREALHLLRHHAAHTLIPTDAVDRTVADHAVGPEQRVLDREAAQLLGELVAELPPVRRRLVQALFADTPQPYAEVARLIGIPVGGIGPTRARALLQLRRRLYQLAFGPETGQHPG